MPIQPLKRSFDAIANALTSMHSTLFGLRSDVNTARSETIVPSRLPGFSGDAIVPFASNAITLANVNVNIGAFGNATHVGTFTVNAKGLTTAAGTSLITPAWGSVTGKPTTLAGYSVTALDVRNTLLTVDGAGSGLDADLLDGQEGSYYTQHAISRAQNLVTNGTGLLRNNTNFSSFVFDASDAYNATGSFTTTIFNSALFSNDLIPINPDKQYRLTGYAKTNPSVGALQYLGIAAYDVDNLDINAQHHMYSTPPTTLALPLNPGDTTMTLTSAAGWNVSTGTFNRGIIVWNYVSSTGFVYPPNTYSRNVYFDLWNSNSDVNTITNVITLKTAWTGPAIPAGTSLSKSNSGGTFKYIALGGAAVPSTWTMYSGTISGVDTTGTNINNRFPPGTASVRILFLVNYTTNGGRVWWSNLSFSEELPNIITATTYGNSTHLPALTLNAQGLVTAVSNTVVTPAWASVTGKPTTLAGYGIADAETFWFQMAQWDSLGLFCVRDGLDFQSNTGRLSYIEQSLTSTSGITFTRSSTGTSINSSGAVVSFSANQPRTTDNGILIEESRTNIILQSEDFASASWLKITGSTADSNVATAPNGTLTADRLTCPATNNANVNQSFSGTSGTVYTFSFWMRAESGTVSFPVHLLDAGGWGTATTINAVATTSWQRFSITRTSAATGTHFVIFGHPSTSNTGARSALFWGAQVEVGSFPTSYIPTTTTSQTRAAETLMWNSLPSQGTIYMDFFAPPAAPLRTYGWNIFDGGNSRLSFRIADVTLNPSYAIGDGTAVSGTVFSPSISAGQLVKSACSFSTINPNAGRMVINGSAFPVTRAVAASIMSSAVNIGGAGANNANTHIRHFAIFPEVLSQEDMITLTTIREPALDLNFTTSQFSRLGGMNQQSPAVLSGWSFSRTDTNCTATALDLAGNVIQFATGVPRITNRGMLVEEARTNSVLNSVGAGAVTGTPGTLPTGWSYGGGVTAGLTASVVGTGSEFGVDYVDLRWNGTTSSGSLSLGFVPSGTTAASAGQAWTGSFFMRLVAGTTTNVTDSYAQVSGVGGSAGFNNGAGGLPTSTFTRRTATHTLGAGATSVTPRLVMVFNVGAAVDITVRLYSPQLELGTFATSPIITTGAAGTRGGDVPLIGSLPAYTSGVTLLVDAEIIQAATGGQQFFVTLSDGTIANRLAILRTGTSNLSFRTVVANVATSPLDVTNGLASNGIYRMGIVSAVGRSVGVLNGTVNAATAPAAVPVTDRIAIGLTEGSAAPANSYIRRIRILPYAASDVELQTLTTAP